MFVYEEKKNNEFENQDFQKNKKNTYTYINSN